jgi:tRNA(His) 5'-end guanylyltransferase
MVGTISLGDRMKAYEKTYTNQQALPLIPTIARLDGKSFHTWTKGLDRPFDDDFIWIMQLTARALVEQTNAILGYTQSDEITLIYYTEDPKSQIFFDGKLHKMTSVLASMCTAIFNEEVVHKGEAAHVHPRLYKFAHKPLAMFDCRVFQVPTKEEAVNCLIWREQDAVRNSIQALGQAHFSHKQLHEKNQNDIQEMLWQERTINWSNLPMVKKRGSYFRRILIRRPFTPDEIDKLPQKHEARKNPSLIVERHEVRQTALPILTKISNRIEVVFSGAEPQVANT